MLMTATPLLASAATLADLRPLLPEIVLTGATFALLMLDLFITSATDERRRWITHVLSVIALLATAALIAGGVGGQGTVLGGMFVRDTMADVLKIVVCLVGALSLLYAWPYLRARGLYK